MKHFFAGRAQVTKKQLDVLRFPPCIGNRKNHGDGEDDEKGFEPNIGREIYSFAHAIAHEA